MALGNANETEINKKVQQHLNKLEEEKFIVEKNLADITQVRACNSERNNQNSL